MDLRQHPDPPQGESREHFIGSRWAAMLWEVYWNLVQEHGFNPDLYQDWTTGGNNLGCGSCSTG